MSVSKLIHWPALYCFFCFVLKISQQRHITAKNLSAKWLHNSLLTGSYVFWNCTEGTVGPDRLCVVNTSVIVCDSKTWSSYIFWHCVDSSVQYNLIDFVLRPLWSQFRTQKSMIKLHSYHWITCNHSLPNWLLSAKFYKVIRITVHNSGHLYSKYSMEQNMSYQLLCLFEYCIYVTTRSQDNLKLT